MNKPELSKKEYARMKARLTKRLNKRLLEPDKLLDEANAALARFEEVIPPDDCERWQRAKEDAERILRVEAHQRQVSEEYKRGSA